MADLNATILDTNEEDEKKHEQQEVKMESEDIVNNEVPPCDICGKTFEKKGQKSLHMKKMHNLKTMQYTPIPRKVGRPASRFICEICKEKKKTDSELRNHMEVNHAGRLICKICKEKKKTERELKNHMTENHASQFICEKCKEKKETDTDLRKHMTASFVSTKKEDKFDQIGPKQRA